MASPEARCKPDTERPAGSGDPTGSFRPYVVGYAVTVVRLASRLRATSAAAAPPNRKIIGGAGTGAGGPPDVPLDPLLPCQPLDPPQLDELQPFDDDP